MCGLILNLPTHRLPHAVLKAVHACMYLSLSGPLDFCLVIQVLLNPCMILNACVHRLDLRFTSHLKDERFSIE